jgi:hypothetical protein
MSVVIVNVKRKLTLYVRLLVIKSPQPPFAKGGVGGISGMAQRLYRPGAGRASNRLGSYYPFRAFDEILNFLEILLQPGEHDGVVVGMGNDDQFLLR